MQHPLNLLQSISQKILPQPAAKTMGKTQAAESAESQQPAASFSRVLGKALQPKAAKTKPESLNQKTEPTEVSDSSVATGADTQEPSDAHTEEPKVSPDLAALQASLLAAPEPLKPDPVPAVNLLEALPQTTETQAIAGEALGNDASNTLRNSQPTTPGQTPSTEIPSRVLNASGMLAAQPEKSIQSEKPASTQENEPGTGDIAQLAQTLPLNALSPEMMALLAQPVSAPIQAVIQEAYGQNQTPGTIPLEALNQTVSSVLNTGSKLSASSNLGPIVSQTSSQAETSLIVTGSSGPNQTETPSAASLAFDHALSTATSATPESQTAAQSLPSDLLPAMEPQAFEQATEAPMAAVNFGAAEPTLSQETITDELSQTNPLGNGKSVKPNGASPVDINTAFKPLADLQSKLQSLNGSVESIREIQENSAATGSAVKTESWESTLKTRDEQETSTSSDVFADALGSAFQTNGAAPTDHSVMANSKVPEFVSQAAQLTDQVVDGTAYSVKNGHKELVLKLNPYDMGEVRINLISHGNNEMSARLIASTPESHELLKSQVDALKASLEAQGIHIERLSVVMAGQAESSANAGQQKENHPEFTQQQQHPANPNHNQQQSFQNPQQNPNLFFQSGGQFQHKQGFAQNPGNQGNGPFQNGSDTASESNSKPEPVRQVYENGSVSILA